MDSLSGTTSPCSVTKLFQKPCITYRSPINEPHSSLSHSPAPSNQQLQFQYPSHHTYIYTTPTQPPNPPTPPPPQLYTPPTLPTSFPCLSPSKQIFSSGIEFGHTYIHTYIHTSLTYLLTHFTYKPASTTFPNPNPKSQIPNPNPKSQTQPDRSMDQEIQMLDSQLKNVYTYTHTSSSLSLPRPSLPLQTPHHHTIPNPREKNHNPIQPTQPNPTDQPIIIIRSN